MDYKGNGEGDLSDPFVIFRTACTHRSFSREYGGQNNEKLEFIGDSVLQLLITELLVERFPKDSEGTLSQMRHKLVNNQVLAQRARKLRLGELVRLGKGEERSGGRDRDRILANTFEACLGAVYLHHDLAVARKIVLVHFGEMLEAARFKSPKQRLHEWSQQTYHRVPEYQELSRTGPAHALYFCVAVFVNEQEISRGSGKSLKLATKAAAEKAVELLDVF
jgi:ribonuclease-3